MYHIVHRAVTAARSAPIEWIAISLQTKAGGFVGSACQNSRNATAVWCSSSSIAFISLHSWKVTWTSLMVLLTVHMSGMSTEIQWPRAELSFCSNHEGAGPGAMLMWPKPKSYLIARNERRDSISLTSWKNSLSFPVVKKCSRLGVSPSLFLHCPGLGKHFPCRSPCIFECFCYWHFCC